MRPCQENLTGFFDAQKKLRRKTKKSLQPELSAARPQGRGRLVTESESMLVVRGVLASKTSVVEAVRNGICADAVRAVEDDMPEDLFQTEVSRLSNERWL